MSRPKLARVLRIAWSVAWGVVAVLLCVLWTRRYGHQDTFGRSGYEFSSNTGTVELQILASPHGTGWVLDSHPVIHIWGDPPAFYHTSALLMYADAPHWALIIVSWTLSAVPWLPWRFSLRTLLIATTLVAA